jgi:hypothetical protein
MSWLLVSWQRPNSLTPAGRGLNGCLFFSGSMEPRNLVEGPGRCRVRCRVRWRPESDDDNDDDNDNETFCDICGSRRDRLSDDAALIERRFWLLPGSAA